MIWSASFLRSEDRNGARFLIYHIVSIFSLVLGRAEVKLVKSFKEGQCGGGITYRGLLLEHCERRRPTVERQVL